MATSGVKVQNLTIDLQASSGNTLVARWSKPKTESKHVDHYEVVWQWKLKLSSGSTYWEKKTETTTNLYSTLSYVSGAIAAKVKVKPISKTYKSKDGKTTSSYFTGSFTSEVEFTYQTLKDTKVDDTITQITITKQKGSDSIYAMWTWDTTVNKNTDHYEYEWKYYTGNGTGFPGDSSTTTSKKVLYSPPSNAKSVVFRVKPVAKTNPTTNQPYWTCKFSEWTEKFIMGFPEVPSAPSVSVDEYSVTVSVECYDSNTNSIQFALYKDDSTKVGDSGLVKVVTAQAQAKFTVEPGYKYKARCRAYNETTGEYSAWSNYSGNNETIPSEVDGITNCQALSMTSVRLDWPVARAAKGYEVEYTQDSSYFDASTGNVSSQQTAVNRMIITGLESGVTWFFRVRAINNQGNSEWSGVASLVLGKKPGIPTTWSNTTTAIVGEDVVLSWVHNTADGSSQVAASLELTINGNTQLLEIQNTASEEDKDKISSYRIPTSQYTIGTTILWRVCTKGITGEFGDWSVQRTVKVHARPTLQLIASYLHEWYWDTFNFEKDNIFTAQGVIGEATVVIKQLPLYICAIAGPSTQTPLSYSLEIRSEQYYETSDEFGEDKAILAGEVIYSKNFDTSEKLYTSLSAGDLSLVNGMTYTITCIVSMNSGLTAEATYRFTIDWETNDWYPNAEFGYNENNHTMQIIPYCLDEDDALVEDVLLSVYRKDFNGEFTEIAKGLENTRYTAVVDPHPNFGGVRYRIVTTQITTGAVHFYDMPPIYIEDPTVIIQWDEKWIPYENEYDAEGELVEPPWTGSLLKLPYNIKISDNFEPDSVIERYIGRRRGVSYYGTQRDHTSSWSVDIDKEDVETLYAIRRLAEWGGDVYVREPSGTGYWANIKVSYTREYSNLTIPVSFSITRVDGGK